MKKILTLLLILSITVAFFACGHKDFDFNDTDSDIDFQGMEFNFLGTTFPDEKTKSSVSNATIEKKYNRVNEVNAKYNVKIVGESGNVSTLVLAASLSGKSGYDIVFCEFTELYDIYNFGALIPFEESGVDDFTSDKWGEEYMTQLSTFGGKRYGFFPNYWNDVPHLFGFPITCLEYLEELNMQNPIEFLEAGEWTWEVFKDELKKATYSDENGEHFGLGMDGIATVYAQTGMISNGGGIMKNINGIMTVTMSDENSKKGIEFMKSLFDEGLACGYGPASVFDTGLYDNVTDAYWGTKTVAYYGGGSGFGTESKEFSIVGVPFPLGPDAEENGYSAIVLEQGLGAVCALSNYSSDEIGIILEELYAALDELYPRGWKDYEVEFNMVDERALKYTMIAMSNAVICNPLACKTTYNEAKITLNDIVHGGASISAIDAVAEAMQTELNEYYNQ